MSNYPFETFPLTKRIGTVNPVANLDARYGPWSTFNDALTGFSAVLRQTGLTVAVSSVEGIKEYWYRDGTDDQNLVLKTEPIYVTNFTTSKTFLSSDASRVFHFDTTTQSLCAIFPSTLPDGFNVAVMNTGTNTLRLSAAELKSVGVTIGVQYGGAFVYKDNNQLFAVGRL